MTHLGTMAPKAFRGTCPRKPALRTPACLWRGHSWLDLLVKYTLKNSPRIARASELGPLLPVTFFLEACDGKFTDEDLTDEGNCFAADYFDFDKGMYLADYERVLAGKGLDLYAVPDTWENFDRLKPLLDKRLSEWKAENG